MFSLIAAGIGINILISFINEILFALSVILSRILDVLYEVFEVFAGIKPVTYNGSKSYLLDVFLGNSVINALFRGMALIGIAMTFAFAIAAVIKKGFDHTGEKVKATYGMILGNILKAILVILLMTGIVEATINATGVLLQQIDFLFNNAEEFANPSQIYFDDQDYATMFRIIDTIGNYSLNQSYNNRFNINACFNSIRGDMQLLHKGGTFDFTYDLTDESRNSWQYALLEIYNASDIYSEHTIDQYDEGLTNAMLACVEKIQQNAKFKPLSYYYIGYTKGSENVSLGRTMMVAASMEAASNSSYNKNPSLHDGLRHAYMVGTKNIYSWTQVQKDFDVSIGKWHHAVATLATWMFIKEFIKMIINCTARIFNMILLYITAPPFIAVMPMDDGGKLKQWATAFTVQSLSIFGSYIAVRLAIVFIPIILSPQLEIFPSSSIKDLFAKIVMMISIVATAEKASGMITGILTDNAGYQSMMAGDVGSGLMEKGKALAGKAIGAALTVGKAVGGVALKEAKLGGKAVADATGLTTKFNGMKDKFTGKFQSMRDKGGYKAAKASGWATNEKEQKAADSKADKDFKSGVLEKLGSIGENTQSPEKKKAAENKKKADNNAAMRGSKSKDDMNQQGKNHKKLEGHGQKLDNIKGKKDDFNIGGSKLKLAPPPPLEKIKPQPPSKSNSKAPAPAPKPQAPVGGRSRSNAVYKKK